MDLDWKHSGLASINDTAEPWLQEILMRSSVDSMFFCQTFLSDSFNKSMTEQRQRHFAQLDDDTIPYSYCCAARGFMKTTSMWGKLVQSTCFRRVPFTMYCSKTLDFATVCTENIKAALLGNQNIREVFGNMKAMKYEGTNPAFSKFAWYAADPVTGEPFAFFAPKGQGQQVNGAICYMNGKMNRVSWIINDDLEDRELVLNEDHRQKLENWYYGALLHCVDDTYPDPKTGRWKMPPLSKNPNWRPPWRVFHQDTIKHEDSLMMKIINDNNYVGNVFPRCELIEGTTNKVKSCAPELWSDEELQNAFDNAKKNHTEDTFAMDIMCLPMAKSMGSWTRSMFKYYDDHDKKEHFNKLPSDDKFIIVDPAKTSKVESAKTAMLAVAFDQESNGIFFRDLVNANLRAEEIPMRAVEMAFATRTSHIFVERTGLEEHIEYLFMSYIEQRGLSDYIEMHWLDARSQPRGGDYGTGKEAAKRARASLLVPYYQTGSIYHENILTESALERQMLSFPKCGFWDAIDCASYVPQILRLGGKFFLPDIETKKDREKELKSMFDIDFDKYDERIKNGDWRLSKAYF